MKYLLIVAAALTLAACSGKTTEEPDADPLAAQAAPTADQITVTAEQRTAIGIQTGPAQISTVNDEIKANGVVDVPPQYMASVSVPIAGIVKTVPVLAGQQVPKGGTLATLQSLDYIQMQQDYLQAVSQLTFQQQELERQRTLNAEDVGARKRLQQAEAEFGSTRALVRSLDLKLRTLGTAMTALQQGQLSPVIRITSPVSGYVTTTNVHIGQQVSPTDILFDVINRDHMHLELKVYENDAFKVRKGQTILLNDAKLGAETVRGTVFLVGKAFQGEAHTITIHGHVSDERQEQRLIPGMYLNARILTGSRQATTLPEEAVVRKGQEGVIYVEVSPNTFKRIPVRIGSAEQGRVEITPLRPADLSKTVLKGAYPLEAELTKGEGEEE
ncbi:efflux RND transporter periplasmic adaptor subunit [Nibrella viscosa]